MALSITTIFKKLFLADSPLFCMTKAPHGKGRSDGYFVLSFCRTRQLIYFILNAKMSQPVLLYFPSVNPFIKQIGAKSKKNECVLSFNSVAMVTFSGTALIPEGPYCQQNMHIS